VKKIYKKAKLQTQYKNIHNFFKLIKTVTWYRTGDEGLEPGNPDPENL
jgi:hypothetical protein